MNLEDKILKLLFEPRFRYKGMNVSFFGIPDLGIYKKQTIRNCVTKLRKRGFIKMGEDKAFITNLGKKHINRKIDSFQNFEYKPKDKANIDLIIMYDIPEEKKAEREWFRWHLKKFGYKMIQRSVWVGPSPLPKDFVDYVKSLNLRDLIKVLKLAKPYGEESFKL